MAHRVSVVVRISESGDSPRNAMATIVTNAASISDVHLVHPGFDPSAVVYDEWTADCAKLIKLGLTPQWHNELDVRQLKSQAVVTLLADHHVTQGAWKILLEEELPFDKRRSRCASLWGPRPTHFALNTGLLLDDEEDCPPQKQTTLSQSMWYGFLLVVGMLDSLRSLVSARHYHGFTTVRAQYVSVMYSDVVRVAPYPWGLWFAWTLSTIAPVRDDGGGCNRVPETRGLPLVMNLIRNHPHMGFGVQWLCGYAIYYGLFAWAVLSTLLSWQRNGDFLYYWIVAHCIHVALVAYATNATFTFPRNAYGIQATLLYPLYLAFSPLVFLYARLRRVPKKKGIRRALVEQPCSL